MVTSEKRNRGRLADATHVLVIVDLVTALFVSFSGATLEVLVRSLIVATLMAAFMIFMFHLSSRRGMRTPAERGLPDKADFRAYQRADRGYSPISWVYQVWAVLVAALTGGPATEPGLLALSVIPLVWAYAHMKRKWPADLERERRRGMPTDPG